jgi:hypothetical protein
VRKLPWASGAFATGVMLALLAATSANAKTQVIRANAVQVTRIGDFRTTYSR